jgi:hypothetical protein
MQPLPSGADLGPWQSGPWPGARRRCSGLLMHYIRTLRDNVAIVAQGGPGRSEFLDPPLPTVDRVLPTTATKTASWQDTHVPKHSAEMHTYTAQNKPSGRIHN